MEEDEPLGRPDVFERPGPDQGQAERLGRGPGSAGIEKVQPDIEIGRRRAVRERGEKGLDVEPFGRRAVFSAPAFAAAFRPGRIAEAVFLRRRNPNHRQAFDSVAFADPAAIEDLHQVAVSLARPDEEEKRLAADGDLAAEERRESGSRRGPLPLGPAVDIFDVGQGSGRKAAPGKLAGQLVEGRPAPAPAESGMDAQGDKHRVTGSARPS